MNDDLITRIADYADVQQAPEAPYQTEVPGLSISCVRKPTAIECSVYVPLVCLVLQGAKESRLGAETVPFSAGQSLIVSHELPAVSRIVDASDARPFIALAMVLDMAILRSLCLEMDITEAPTSPARAIVAGAADDGFIDAMERLFSLTGKPRDQSVLLPLLKREVHYRLLCAGHGDMLRRLARQDSHASRITQAIAYIRENIAASIRIADLTEIAGMSPSTFHEHFKAITATTPLQFQKDLRLLTARESLRGGTRSVTSVAFDVGYESPTQFSREYTRKFGTSPRADRLAA